MSTADQIIDQIDSAVEDWTISEDAMRSRPTAETVPATGIWIGPVGAEAYDETTWQRLEGVTGIDFGPEQEVYVITVDTTEAVEQLRRLSVGLQALTEASKPACEAASANVDHCPPPSRRDRPAWQSPYGPPRRRS